MNYLLAFLFAACLFVITGCSSVDFSSPIGQPVNDTSTPGLEEAINGTWVLTHDANEKPQPLFLRYRGHGWIEAVGLEVNDSDNSENNKWQGSADTVPAPSFGLGDQFFAQLRHSEDRWFLHLVAAEDAKNSNKQYSLMLLKSLDTTDQLVLWTSSPEAFRTAIEKEEIAGTIEQRDNSFTAHVTADSQSVLAWLQESNIKNAFFYEEPIILRRVAR